MATPAKRPREENNDQNNADAELKTLCTNRANAFLKWFSSNDDNFFNEKVCLLIKSPIIMCSATPSGLTTSDDFRLHVQ